MSRNHAIPVPRRQSAPVSCNCLALRQATRRLSHIYDGFLESSGVRGTQFSILGMVKSHGGLTINELAEIMVMDRTTLGRNLQPLRRDGLVAIAVGKDRRSREIRLTEAGTAVLRKAVPLWQRAQASFEAQYGRERAAQLRAMLHDISQLDAET